MPAAVADDPGLSPKRMAAADVGLSSARPPCWIRAGGRPAKASRGTGDGMELLAPLSGGKAFPVSSSESVRASAEPTDQTVGSQPATFDVAVATGALA